MHVLFWTCLLNSWALPSNRVTDSYIELVATEAKRRLKSQSPSNRVTDSYSAHEELKSILTEVSQSPSNRVTYSYENYHFKKSIDHFWSQSPSNRVTDSYLNGSSRCTGGGKQVAIPFKSGHRFLLLAEKKFMWSSTESQSPSNRVTDSYDSCPPERLQDNEESQSPSNRVTDSYWLRLCK